jgi:hypothetical protein
VSKALDIRKNGERPFTNVNTFLPNVEVGAARVYITPNKYSGRGIYGVFDFSQEQLFQRNYCFSALFLGI